MNSLTKHFHRLLIPIVVAFAFGYIASSASAAPVLSMTRAAHETEIGSRNIEQTIAASLGTTSVDGALTYHYGSAAPNECKRHSSVAVDCGYSLTEETENIRFICVGTLRITVAGRKVTRNQHGAPKCQVA